MPEEEYEFTPTDKLMQVNEIEALAKIFVAQGVNKIRLTGGEPLVRKDAAAIILALSKLPVQLTMTTNGTRVHDFVDILEEAKIRISLSPLFLKNL
jgi:cyclic pyranopterin phosphate synthase